jgi:arginine/lysine/ornithine decarboxylase
VLTGGAYLHICNDLFTESYKEHMKVFASTSPSYLTLMSLDYANLYLSDPENIKTMNDTAKSIAKLKEKYGITTAEPYKIAVKTTESAEKLCETYNTEPEYVSDDVLLFMFSGCSTYDDIEAAEKVLAACKLSNKLTDNDKAKMLSGLGYNLI